jgi:hypothetical protein
MKEGEFMSNGLKNFVYEKGVYIGVSAGSWTATNNLPDSLGYINRTLSVHAEVGIKRIY